MIQQSLASADVTEVRQSNNVNVIKTMLHPQSGSTALATNEAGASGFVQNITTELTFKVVADIPAIPGDNLEHVPSASGMVLWLTQDGLNSLFHMGFVPGGAVVELPSGGPANTPLRGMTTQGTFYGPNGTGAAFAGLDFDANGWHIDYTAEVALPRSGVGNIIKLSPELDKNFSRVKSLAGSFTVQGSTVSIGVLALDGQLAGGAVADPRDIAQNTANGVATSYSGSDLKTGSVTVKDGVSQVSLQDGMIMIIGPDLPNKFTAPRQVLTDTLEAEYFVLDSIIKFQPNLFGALVGTPDQTAPAVTIFQMYVTPWKQNMWVATAGQLPSVVPTYYTRVDVDPIGETGVIDIKVEVKLGMAINADPAAPNDWQKDNVMSINVNAMHIYERIGADGAVHRTVFSERYSEQRSMAWVKSAAGSRSNSNDSSLMCTFEPRRFRKSFDETGKYMGSNIYASAQWDKIEAISALSRIIVNVSAPIISISARNDDKEGRLQAHIIRYDNASPTQQITMRGLIKTLAIPRGQVAAFVQAAIAAASTASDSDVLNFALGLWNSDNTTFRRIYPLQEYNRDVLGIVDTLNSQLLEVLASRSKSGLNLRASGQAAGLFGIIRGVLPAALDLGEQLFGGEATGQFSGLSAGQFGSQFGGSSTGQFGGLSAGQMRGMSAGQFIGQSAGQIRQRF